MIVFVVMLIKNRIDNTYEAITICSAYKFDVLKIMPKKHKYKPFSKKKKETQIQTTQTEKILYTFSYVVSSLASVLMAYAAACPR